MVLVQRDRPASFRPVHRSRSGHPWHLWPNTAFLLGVIATVNPWGQVTVPAAVSMAKSSMVNPPGTAERSGIGLITAWCLASTSAARTSPEP